MSPRTGPGMAWFCQCRGPDPAPGPGSLEVGRSGAAREPLSCRDARRAIETVRDFTVRIRGQGTTRSALRRAAEHDALSQQNLTPTGHSPRECAATPGRNHTNALVPRAETKGARNRIRRWTCPARARCPQGPEFATGRVAVKLGIEGGRPRRFWLGESGPPRALHHRCSAGLAIRGRGDPENQAGRYFRGPVIRGMHPGPRVG